MDRVSKLRIGFMRNHQRGFTLYEVIAALAIGSMIMASISLLINNSLDDTKGQQAALYQAQIASAASKYISDNYATLLTGASTTTAEVVTFAKLQNNETYLASSVQSTNAYGQTPCVLILKNSSGKLDALVVTEGGLSIPDNNIAYVSANAGESGGYIKSDLSAAGAFNSWQLSTAGLAPYLTGNCSGTPAGANHLASALFFDGPGTPSTDYLYRDPITGHPELNQMNTPLHIVNGGTSPVVSVANQSDVYCTTTDTSTYGGITTDAQGEVLSCQSGIWKLQPNNYWKDPVASTALLPTTGNNSGDVRMILGTNAAYTWIDAVTGWKALAFDTSGNLTVPGLLTTNAITANGVVTANNQINANGLVALGSTQTAATACSTNGSIARDANGSLLSCTSGYWRYGRDYSIDPNYTYYNYYKTTADGDGYVYINLSSIPGNRPLYTSGYIYCNSVDSSQVVGAVEIHDASDNVIGWSGGCGAIASTSRVDNKGFMPLVQLPYNATSLKVLWWPRNGSSSNYVDIFLYVYNSL